MAASHLSRQEYRKTFACGFTLGGRRVGTAEQGSDIGFLSASGPDRLSRPVMKWARPPGSEQVSEDASVSPFETAGTPDHSRLWR
jgi:hypothetical protein